jgi:hypothetical protein
MAHFLILSAIFSYLLDLPVYSFYILSGSSPENNEGGLMRIGRRDVIAAVLVLGLTAPALMIAQASKKLEEATKRMESPQQKMEHADKIMRDQDRLSSKRGVVDKRKDPKARPGVKRMVLPEKR